MQNDVIILGYSRLAEELIVSQMQSRRPILRFRGMFADMPIGRKFHEVEYNSNKISVPIMGDLNDFPDILDSHFSSNKPILIVAVDEERDKKFLQNISRCIVRGYEIYEVADIYEMTTGRIPVLHIRENWLLHSFGMPKIGHSVFKKIIDTAVALTGVIVTLPLIVVIGALIKATSHGPVFYKQVRVGKGGKEFVIYKFRTMVDGAERDEAVWAVKNDPRTTLVGKCLRKMRLDELPQLVNVLKGDMSIIGPRPERPEFVSKLSEEIPFYNYRHIVKPGITGWAQVRYRYACSVEGSLQKLQYDLYGIKNASVEYDIEVLLRTIWVMFSGAGAH